MATILLIEDVLDLGAYEAGLLEDEGHRVIICRGSPVPFSACPLMRDGSCGVAGGADLLLFSADLFAPVSSQPHRGLDLLRRYREHPEHGAKPCLVVAVGDPGPLAGSGPVRTVSKFAPAREIVRAIDELLGERAKAHPGGGR